MKSSTLRARYWRIVFFFGRVTAGFIFWEIFMPRIGLRGWSNSTRSGRYQRIATRFRRLAIKMGGLMIKVGQFLSARLDVLPPEITDELAGLQDEVPAENFEAIRKQAENDLGAALSSKYETFDESPMAAASLGQVHRARLLPAEAKALVDAALLGNREEARRLHALLLPMIDALFLESNPAPLNAALAMAGYSSDAVRLPLAPASEATRARLAELFPTFSLSLKKG